MLFRNLKAEFLRHRDLRPDDRKDMILKIFDDILETDSLLFKELAKQTTEWFCNWRKVLNNDLANVAQRWYNANK
jgi:hypothetical protein